MEEHRCFQEAMNREVCLPGDGYCDRIAGYSGECGKMPVTVPVSMFCEHRVQHPARQASNNTTTTRKKGAGP